MLSNAYLAGLFDGEGSIVISKRSYKLKHGERVPWYTLVVCLSNTHLPTILELREMFKSRHNRKVYRLKASSKPRVHPQRVCYQWHAASDIAEEFLWYVLPYLRIKQEEAELALKFREHVRQFKNEHRRFVNSRADWFGSEMYRAIHAERETMYLKMRALKRPVFLDYDGIAANSEKAPCPAPSRERGRVTPSQAGGHPVSGRV